MDNIKYLEKQFNYYYKKTRYSSNYLYEYHAGTKVTTNNLNFATYWTHEYLKRMYNIICVYFELLGLQEYLIHFKSIYQEIIDDEKKSIEISNIILNEGKQKKDLKIFIEWKKILAPFKFSWD